jgi:hypothetical protein
VHGIEVVHPVVGGLHCIGWVVAEGGADGVADVVCPALDANLELHRAE